MAGRAGVVAVGCRERVHVLTVVGGQSALGVLERLREAALVEEATGEQLVRVGARSAVQRSAGQGERLVQQGVCALVVAAHLVEGAQLEQRPAELVVLAETLGEFAGAEECALGAGVGPAARGDQRRAEHRLERELGGPALLALVDALEHLQAGREVIEGLPMGEPLEGLLGRESKRDHGARHLAGADEVIGELRSDLAGARAVGDLEPLADVAVQSGTAGGRQPLVDDLSLQVVAERKAGSDRAVGPAVLAVALEEATRACERAAASLDLCRVAVERGRNGSQPRSAVRPRSLPPAAPGRQGRAG